MTKRLLSATRLGVAALLVVVACGHNSAARPSPLPADAGWQLTWADEFNEAAGTLPSAARWTADTGASGWGNQELQHYCAPGEAKAPCDVRVPNAATDGRGSLVISAVRNAAGQWTSARLKTEGVAPVHYGRIEARLKVPTGQGLWPAFWALGTDLRSVGWPTSGEIDIMENVAADVPGGLGADVTKATLHGPGYSGGAGQGQIYRFPNGGRVDDGFHTYGVVWSPTQLQFYVDRVQAPYFTVTPADLPRGTAWVFDKPFFLLLNVAVGGSWPKDPGPTTPNPAQMLVDYVRVYAPNPTYSPVGATARP